MKKFLLFWVLGCGMLHGAFAAEKMELLWSLDCNDPADVAKVEGAELIVGGGPDGRNCIRLKGPNMPAIRLDTRNMRGRMVMAETMVKGEKLSQKFGECLKFVPAYQPQFREDWCYRPQAVDPIEKTDWMRFHTACRIFEQAGDFKLVLGHAGENGVAYYSDVKLYAVPKVEALDPANAGKPPFKTRYRGAMAGRLSKESDFREFSEEWNGNILRWQFLDGPARFDSPEDYLNWGRNQIAKLEKVMPYIRKYKIKVVIDLHRGPGKMNHVLNNLGLWDKSQQDVITALWREIATRFKGDPAIYGYDLVNEPVDKIYDLRSEALDWNRFAEYLAHEIRKIDPATPIVIQPTTMHFNAFYPVNLPNIIYSPHIYEPGEYTHQGIRNRAMVGPYPDATKGWNKKWLRHILKPLRDFQLRYNVPIYVGEFGVIRWAPGGAQWLDDYMELFEEFGWDWTFHAYREWSGWSVEHGSDKNNETKIPDTDRKQIVLKHFKKNPLISDRK